MSEEIRNVGAERLVIGCLCLHPEWFIELGGKLKTDHFTMKPHKMIFHIISKLLAENIESINSLVIMARAEKIKNAVELLDESGGYEYIDEIIFLSEEVVKATFHKFVEDVVTCAFKREQLLIVNRFTDYIIENPQLTANEVAHRIDQDQMELRAKFSSNTGIESLEEVFDNTWGEIESMSNGDGTVGILSKIGILNRYFTYMNGELVVIGARAKYGKSNFAINEIHNISVVNGIPSAYFDTEMKTRTFLLRLVAIDSGVTLEEIKSGSYKQDIDKLLAVESSKERIRNAPITHIYRTDWTRDSVAQTAKLLYLKKGIRFLVYDYIKVKEVGGSQNKEHNELGNWTISLKDLAGDLDIPILSFGQLSPFERRLADSDKINRYASTIAYLLPKSDEEVKRDMGAENGGRDMIFVDYNRNGANMNDDETKGVNIFYERSTATMIEADYQCLILPEE